MKLRILQILFAGVLCASADAVQALGDVAFAYQGRVRVQGQAFNGTGQFKFSIVDTSGANTLWSNDGSGSAGNEPTGHLQLPVEDGIFNVMIGDTSLGMSAINPTIFNAPTPLKLRVWFNDGSHGFQKLNPDHNLVNLTLTVLTTGNSDFTIYVDKATGDDDDNGLTLATAKQTIQAALDILPDRIKCNVTISVAPATYREMVAPFGFTVIPGKTLTLVGDQTWTPAVGGFPNVTISGLDTVGGPKVRTHAINATGCSNMTIQGFHLTGTTGQGIRLENGTYTVRNCVARDAGTHGIVATRNCFANFINCEGSNNSQYGLAITEQSACGVTSCTANSNTVGGLALFTDSYVTLHDSTLLQDNGALGVLVFGGCFLTTGAGSHKIAKSTAGNAVGVSVGLKSTFFGSSYFTFSGAVSPTVSADVSSSYYP